MNRFLVLSLAVVGSMMSTSCDRAEIDYVDPGDLASVLKVFEGSSSNRSDDVHHSTTIMMEDYSFFVGTQEAKRREGEKWDFVFEGPSRESGFFVVPRMAWLDTIEEVEAVIREDLKARKGIPTEVLLD